MRIVFPDSLTWQSGIEFGLQALGALYHRGAAFEFSLPDHGPMLEAATFAIIQYQLHNKVRWVHRWPRSFAAFDVAIFPRVVAIEKGSLTQLLHQGVTVISSDPEFQSAKGNYHRFARRDWQTMAGVLNGLMKPSTQAA
jgi:hypothetical protein